MKDITEKWIREDGEKSLTEIGIQKGQMVLDFGMVMVHDSNLENSQVMNFRKGNTERR